MSEGKYDAKVPWYSMLILAIMVGTMFFSAFITTINYFMEAKGYVGRASLADIRSTEYEQSLWVGECRRDIGKITVTTIDQTPEQVRETLIHEFFHCVVWDELRSPQEKFRYSYKTDIVLGTTTASNVEEWAADQFSAWCVDGVGNPVVFSMTKDYLELWNCLADESP